MNATPPPDTPTPRTDEHLRLNNETLFARADFARQLETELAAAQAEARELREALQEIATKCEHFLGCPVGPATIAEIARAALAKHGGEKG